MYKADLECKVCGKILSTDWCKTKIGRWIKIQKIKKKHCHTKTEKIFEETTRIYYPTTKKEYE